MQKALGRIRVVSFSGLAFGLLFVLALRFQSDPAMDKGLAGIILIGAALSAFVAFIDRIELFKVGLTGMEARTRAAADQAFATLEAVQDLAASFGAEIVEAGASLSTWGGSSPKQRLDRKLRVIETLKRSGVSEEKIRGIYLADAIIIIKQYISKFFQDIYEVVPHDKKKAISDLSVRWGSAINHLTPDEMREISLEFGVPPESVATVISDYEHYLRTGDDLAATRP